MQLFSTTFFIWSKKKVSYFFYNFYAKFYMLNLQSPVTCSEQKAFDYQTIFLMLPLNVVALKLNFWPLKSYAHLVSCSFLIIEPHIIIMMVDFYVLRSYACWPMSCFVLYIPLQFSYSMLAFTVPAAGKIQLWTVTLQLSFLSLHLSWNQNPYS